MGLLRWLWGSYRIMWSDLCWLAETVGYWVRPYDMLADARRWRWQARQPCGFGSGSTWHLLAEASARKAKAAAAGLPRFHPAASLVVDGPLGLEEWSGAQWNDLADRAERDRTIVAYRFVEVRDGH